MAKFDTDPAFDAQMRSYFRNLRAQTLSRRGLVKGAAGTALAAGVLPMIRPGVAVLAQDDTSITFGLESDIRGVEPALAYDFTANPVVDNITEGLLRIDSNNELQPMLAESWSQPDPTTYIYNLRQGVTFHDGTPVTVADVLASIDRVKNNTAIASPMAWMYDPAASIEQTGEMQITIKLTQPGFTFQYVVATTAGHVMPKALIDSSPDQPIVQPVGTGPYKFVKWDAGSEIQLEKNGSYWQSGKPYFQTAVFKIVPDPTTRVAGLKTGDLQMVRDIPPDQIDTVKALPDITWQEVVGYTAEMIAFVNNKPPFDDPKAREAVSKAIDYGQIMTNLVKEAAVLAHATTVPSNMPGSAEDQLQPVPFDLEGAKAALAASKNPNGFKFTLTVDAESSLRVAEAQAIQQMLQAINVEVEINKIPQPDRITLLQSGDYDGMVFHEWGSDFPDANGMLLPLFHSRNVPPQNNQSFYSNPQVDQLLDAADQSTDEEGRKQQLIDAQKLIAADMPVVWLDHNKWFLPVKKGLGGYSIGPLFYWDSFLRDLKPV